MYNLIQQYVMARFAHGRLRHTTIVAPPHVFVPSIVPSFHPFRFLPLEDLYKKRYAMDGPAVPAVPDDCAGSVRIRGLKAFAAAVSGEPLGQQQQAAPGDLQYHDGDGLMLTSAGSHRESSRSEYSEASTGSGSHHMPHDRDGARLFELALRPSGPSSQHSGRAPPGMAGGGGGGGGSMVGPGGERTTRSFSGPGPMGTSGYFGSGSSLGAGSEGDGWRASKGTGPGGMYVYTSRLFFCVFRFFGKKSIIARLMGEGGRKEGNSGCVYRSLGSEEGEEKRRLGNGDVCARRPRVLVFRALYHMRFGTCCILTGLRVWCHLMYMHIHAMFSLATII